MPKYHCHRPVFGLATREVGRRHVETMARVSLGGICVCGEEEMRVMADGEAVVCCCAWGVQRVRADVREKRGREEGAEDGYVEEKMMKMVVMIH